MYDRQQRNNIEIFGREKVDVNVIKDVNIVHRGVR